MHCSHLLALYKMSLRVFIYDVSIVSFCDVLHKLDAGNIRFKISCVHFLFEVFKLVYLKVPLLMCCLFVCVT